MTGGRACDEKVVSGGFLLLPERTSRGRVGWWWGAGRRWAENSAPSAVPARSSAGTPKHGTLQGGGLKNQLYHTFSGSLLISTGLF